MNIRDFIQRPVHFIRGSIWQQNDIHFLWQVDTQPALGEVPN